MRVAQEGTASYRRVGPAIRGTWSQYADRRLEEALESSISRTSAAVPRQMTGPPREQTHALSSPMSGWVTSEKYHSEAQGETRPLDVTSVSANGSKNTNLSRSQQQGQHEQGPNPQHSGLTTEQSSFEDDSTGPVEHDSPPTITTLPHAHFRSPTQSKPGRGSPYPYFHDVGHAAPLQEDATRSTPQATTQHKADLRPRAQASNSQTPLSDDQLSTSDATMEAQQQRAMDDAGVTDRLIDLAYTITEGMTFKDPPSTPRRTGLSA